MKENDPDQQERSWDMCGAEGKDVGTVGERGRSLLLSRQGSSVIHVYCVALARSFGMSEQ